jgi:hypothetical protein
MFRTHSKRASAPGTPMRKKEVHRTLAVPEACFLESAPLIQTANGQHYTGATKEKLVEIRAFPKAFNSDIS